MGINVIDTATLVGLKAGADIYNANFTDSTNAASKLVGLLTGNVPTADDLSMVGQTVNYTAANFQPSTRGGLNNKQTLINSTGSSIAPDALISGSLLKEFITDTNGVVLGFGAIGTTEIYKSMTSFSMSNNSIGYFTRVS
mgnify:CR=1 FL=1